MTISFTNAKVYQNGRFKKEDFVATIPDILNGKAVADDISVARSFNNCCIIPTFCDVHVHLREPGFFYKETIKSGTLSAAKGGYTDVFTMPNLNPVPDNINALNLQLAIIEKDAVINVHPYASITKGEKGEELSDFTGLSPLCAGFSDDGRGVQSEEIMKSAMEKAKQLGKIIVAHCEDNRLLFGGCIHAGTFAKEHNLKGICSKSEWLPIKRDLELAKKTGCKYHVCHISTKESVELIRAAKAQGVDVTCETAPHYLVLNDAMLKDNGGFKMNPPIRSEKDRKALIEGIKDGTIDMIATDHAPHSKEEKSGGLEKSLMGVVGLETAFPILYTHLVKKNIISLEKLIELMSINPRKRFMLPETKDYCVYDLNSVYKIDPQTFLTKGRSTPFENETVYGENLMTIHGGKAVWLSKRIKK